ncbi:DUF362 domain-containing protein, partial [candidate division WOR-3 bacterium]|nr:DUF362 domain-containing protein [candidate division WOR-3 bacterium]
MKDMDKKAKVHFSGVKNATAEEALLKLIPSIPEVLKGTVAVKVHFGERGNKTHLSSDLLAALLKALGEKARMSFVTDTNVLYRSERSRTVSHLNLAYDHGFCQEKLKVPVLIADGYDGGDVVRVKTKGVHFKNFPVGGAIFRADSLLVFSHFKGHLLAGVGGAIKNLSMGGASRAGKQMMHA